MPNIKPSELPFYTIIEFDDEQYIRMEAYYGPQWQTLHCVDCGAGSEYSDAQADFMFTEFKIISSPVSSTYVPHGEEGHEGGLTCTMCFFGFEATPGEINQILWFMSGTVMRKDEKYKTGFEVINEVRRDIHDYNNPKPGEH